jgi:hypothetical protein
MDLSKELLGDFENHTRSIGSKLVRQMGYGIQGIGKRIQGISNPIVFEYVHLIPFASKRVLGSYAFPLDHTWGEQ